MHRNRSYFKYVPSTHTEEFKDTKGVIRICISKKNRQHNGQKKKYKRRTHKAKDRVTRTPLKIGGEPECSGKLITDKLRGLIKI